MSESVHNIVSEGQRARQTNTHTDTHRGVESLDNSDTPPLIHLPRLGCVSRHQLGERGCVEHGPGFD